MPQSIEQTFQQLVKELTPEHGVGEAQSLARLLFEDQLSWRRGQRDRELAPEEEERLQTAVTRLQEGEPLQYITGRADFFGLALHVTPAVLIPRPETEELVEWVLEYRRAFPSEPVLLDIGTGSGCIPLALKDRWPQAQVYGLDVSEAALAVAKSNAENLELSVDWLLANILNKEEWLSLPAVHILISNPPYIPHSEANLMPESVKRHEPDLALFVENDEPLIFYEKIMQLALQRLKPNGLLFFECNEFNAEQVHELGKQLGFINAELRKDLQGKWRMWKGHRPQASDG